ncbi:acc synthase [Xylariaceae sp. FL1019]|nr:acc synthase [Xylariaceae sp. FL1019]
MLSSRGSKWAEINFNHGAQNEYNPVTNPEGTVSFANAENWLLLDELASFINANAQFTESHLTYGEGFTGTIRLRNAMAAHMNAHFSPVQEITAEEVTFAAGVTGLNEVCALLTCDPGQCLMLGAPVYGSFSRDLVVRTGVELEYVDVGDMDQFTPSCVAAFEKGYERAKTKGRDIMALIICNPHNPLGQCYPRETLLGLLNLCAAKGIHLISDEIYALSTYSPTSDEPESFTSVRSVNCEGTIDPKQVHVLYGMSKDFGAAGLRLGCLVSQNEQLTKAARAICRFSSPSQFSMELAAKILEDQTFVIPFLEKSSRCLTQARALAEQLLTEINISYHKPGNAGFFLWLDLSPYLPSSEASGDGWTAHRQLAQRFRNTGVIMSSGETYKAPHPGRFRLIFSIPESSLREGVRRIASVIKS